MYRTIKPLGVLAFLVAFTVGTAFAAEFTIVQGSLIDEDCLKAKLTPCPLEKFTGEKLVLVTADEKVYRIEEYGVADWKMAKAYTQLVGVKGLKEGDTIKVTDLVQITGAAALTKACK